VAAIGVAAAEEYGTGAVVDYRSGVVEDSATIILTVGPSRAWTVNRFGIISEPSTETTDDKSRGGFRNAVVTYLSASGSSRRRCC
jgi:hypothetical protein